MKEFKVGDPVVSMIEIDDDITKGKIYIIEDVTFGGWIKFKNNKLKYCILHGDNFRPIKLDHSEKEGFKVDKLGWYKGRDGGYYDVIHKLNERNCCYIYVSKDNEEFYSCNKEGLYHGNDGTKSQYDLIEYIGEELPVKKEPRHFEFEGYMPEYLTDTVEKGDCNVISRLLGSPCGSFHNHKIEVQDGKASKWHVSMTEILEDK